jgi:hypothetical protein
MMFIVAYGSCILAFMSFHLNFFHFTRVFFFFLHALIRSEERFN